MDLLALRRTGHAPSLVAALLHFDVSFMAWVLFGALGAYIGDERDAWRLCGLYAVTFGSFVGLARLMGSYGPGIGAIAAVAAVALCGTLVVRGAWIAPAGARA